MPARGGQGGPANTATPPRRVEVGIDAGFDRLPGSGPRGVRPRARRMAGCAIPTSSAGHAPAGAAANPKLTFQPDHPAGADHTCPVRRRFDFIGATGRGFPVLAGCCWNACLTARSSRSAASGYKLKHAIARAETGMGETQTLRPFPLERVGMGVGLLSGNVSHQIEMRGGIQLDFS